MSSFSYVRSSVLVGRPDKLAANLLDYKTEIRRREKEKDSGMSRPYGSIWRCIVAAETASVLSGATATSPEGRVTRSQGGGDAGAGRRNGIILCDGDRCFFVRLVAF